MERDRAERQHGKRIIGEVPRYQAGDTVHMPVYKPTLYMGVEVWSLLGPHELYYTDKTFNKYCIIVFYIQFDQFAEEIINRR